MSLKSVIKDINNLKIQGATAIAQEAIRALISESKSVRQEGHQFIVRIEKMIADLLATRSTEPLMQNGLAFILVKLRQTSAKPASEMQAILEKTGLEYLELITDSTQKIVAKGKSLLKKNDNIFTHCHSSLVEKIIIAAWQDKNIAVYNTETRPLFQGRITAQNLLAQGVPTTMVADSAADFLISKHSGKELMMNIIILGADSISWEGNVYNKIGSYGIALAAWEAKIPLYIAATALKMDADNKIQIELRASSEIWSLKPGNLKILNFAFDLIPAKFITGIITEFGIVKPSLLKAKVAKNYSWLLKD
ncbi:MAG: hypothetical protein AUJ28_01455 [Parcubacteria group bacterium CG1_02_37_51]|uniref:Translation initiation factor eIF-2B n=2 Tax=Candidatus Komeiliibacteriota TaxID=1817908 RepID=A0A2M8DR18_9BACT|nr:MAG: hypothetical protein AUJ28_01455 [Parcubacteria group bacterium CG1_02_37_51]PIY95280.1 MAG: hypothetical protein COY67_00775 [Candidatus Komeilibacteria bacterium CG_4_10_14_0_8_um_filter_37_78]PJC01835.1 MAG: hypothetical protein CO073_02640 [Candidatus Komeilibacteria bacterium CG_4_9_14_0_8_um_filter_36_9]